nr:hypothetical protein [Spirochaetaceae bacterium]
ELFYDLGKGDILPTQRRYSDHFQLSVNPCMSLTSRTQYYLAGMEHMILGYVSSIPLLKEIGIQE